MTEYRRNEFEGSNLMVDAAEILFGQMLDGTMSDDQIATTLIEISSRGETTDDIVGAVRAIRARMLPIQSPPNAMDVSGTGGDGQHSLNISTAVSIVVAAMGVPIAKCGNRAASSKAGAADTLEALGLDINRATERAEDTLSALGIGFIFAQRQVPILARVAPIRKSLGHKTIFNLIGPLINMASVKHQFLGVPHPDVIPVFAAALWKLGIERAMVVSGEEGLDELSISGPSRIATLGFGFWSDRVSPEDAGLHRHPAHALKGGDQDYNAKALQNLLNGEAGAYRDAVLLNAAGALTVADRVTTLSSGVKQAADAIDKGVAKTLLDRWVAIQ